MTRRMLPMATVTPPIRAEQGSRRRDRDAPDEGRASVGRRGVRRRLRLQRSRSRGGRIPRQAATWWTVRPRSRSSQRTCPAVASGDNSGWVKAQLLLRNGQPIRRRWIQVKGSGDVGLAWLSHRTKEQALWLRSHRCNESARVRLLLLAPRPGLGPDVRSEWCRGVPAGGRPGHVVGFEGVPLAAPKCALASGWSWISRPRSSSFLADAASGLGAVGSCSWRPSPHRRARHEFERRVASCRDGCRRCLGRMNGKGAGR